MGATIQSAGHFHIHLEIRNFQAGESIPGVIHLKLKETIQANTLNLLFDGTEYVKYRFEFTGMMQSETSHVINQRFPVFMLSEGKLSPGDYSFPFVFTLPKDIPGSFRLKEGHTEACIAYTVSAMVEGTTAFIDSAQVEVHISQLMSDPIYSLSDTTLTSLRLCGFNLGHLGLKIAFSKSAYVPGETVHLVLDINNSQSRLDVQGFVVGLYRLVKLRSENGFFERKEGVEFWNVPLRIPKGEALLGEQSRHENLVLPVSSIDTSTSVHSTHIDCIYSLRIHIKMNAGWLCSVDSPEIEQAIVIYPTQLPQVVPPEVPQDWQPKEMPGVQFAADQVYNYTPS